MNVVITGGTSRLGEALVRRLCAQGHRVAFTFNTATAAAAHLSAQTGALSVHVDLMSLTATIAEQVLCERVGFSPDALVNNSSLFSYDMPQDLNEALLRQCMSINLLAPLLLTDAFLKTAAPGQVRTVVNILDNRVVAPNPDYFSYSLSKMALASATRLYAAHPDSPHRVYGVAPAMFAESGAVTAGRVDDLVRKNPMNHPLNVDDVVNSVEFCLRGLMKSGEVLVPDAGQHLLALPRDVAYLPDAD